MHVKLVCHPTLPLAWATSGVGELDGVTVSQRLRQFGEGIQPADLNAPGHFLDAADAYFRPLVEQEQGFPEYAADPGKVMLGLHIAWSAGGAIKGGLFVVHPPADSSFDALEFRLSAEGAVLEAIRQAFPEGDLLEGRHLNDANTLAVHFRQLIDIGAAAERVAQHNRRLMLGGPVDVALVDAAGARRL
jgi:hypothetical protein